MHPLAGPHCQASSVRSLFLSFDSAWCLPSTVRLCPSNRKRCAGYAQGVLPWSKSWDTAVAICARAAPTDLRRVCRMSVENCVVNTIQTRFRCYATMRP
jgi:hypothetical protein